MNIDETQHKMKVYIINDFNNIETMNFNLYYNFSNSEYKIHIQIPYQKIHKWILILFIILNTILYTNYVNAILLK